MSRSARRCRRTCDRGRAHGLALLALAFILSAPGCQSIDKIFVEAREGDAEERQEALEELHERIRNLRGDKPRVREERAKLEVFLPEQYRLERDPVNRARLIDLSLQAELPCAKELVVIGARDRSLLVQRTAILGIVEAKPDGAREILTELLIKDKDLTVRIEAVKAIRVLGSADWVGPVVDVILAEGSEDRNLRVQCHLTAQKLLGVDFPLTVTHWKAWRESQPAPEEQESGA